MSNGIANFSDYSEIEGQVVSDFDLDEMSDQDLDSLRSSAYAHLSYNSSMVGIPETTVAIGWMGSSAVTSPNPLAGIIGVIKGFVVGARNVLSAHSEEDQRAMELEAIVREVDYELSRRSEFGPQATTEQLAENRDGNPENDNNPSSYGEFAGYDWGGTEDALGSTVGGTYSGTNPGGPGDNPDGYGSPVGDPGGNESTNDGEVGVSTGGAGDQGLGSGWGGLPVVLDLDGDGVEITFGSGVSFDWDDDGFLEATSWAAPDDGFLVLDLNADGTRGDGDGVIDQARELAFAQWGEEGDTDLQALARTFDSNGDGVLSAEDDAWSELRVWQDMNQNGVTDTGELRSLADWGITEIALGYDDGTGFDDSSNDITVFGNTLHGLASFTHDGSVLETGDEVSDGAGSYTRAGGVGDVALAHKALGWRGVATAWGAAIETEDGHRSEYAILDENKGHAANLNINDHALTGAFGDYRDNIITGSNALRSVLLSGGDGDDTLIGGAEGDLLAGDAGADVLRGGCRCRCAARGRRSRYADRGCGGPCLRRGLRG